MPWPRPAHGSHWREWSDDGAWSPESEKETEVTLRNVSSQPRELQREGAFSPLAAELEAEQAAALEELAVQADQADQAVPAPQRASSST